MASRRNEVEKSMNTVVPEAGVTLDSRFFGKDVIVLTLEVPDNFTETIMDRLVLFVALAFYF